VQEGRKKVRGWEDERVRKREDEKVRI